MAFGAKLELPSPDLALPGRDASMPVPDGHFVHGQPLVGPFPGHFKRFNSLWVAFGVQSDECGRCLVYSPQQ